MPEIETTKAGLHRVEVIASLFGVSVRRVQQLTQEGIINTVPIVENGHTSRRYELVPTIQKYIQYLSEKAYGKQGKTEKEIELREQKLQADIALKESQGELHRLKTEIAAGKYITIEEVKMDYARFFMTFKKFALSLPLRVGGMLTGAIDPVEARKLEKDVAAEINQLLESFVVAGTGPKEVESGKKKKNAQDPAV